MVGQIRNRTSKTVDSLALARKAKSGDVRAISQVMTLVENHEPSTKAVLRVLSPPKQRPMVIGMTGYPGAGKSSLIAQLTRAYRQQGKKSESSRWTRQAQSPEGPCSATGSGCRITHAIAACLSAVWPREVNMVESQNPLQKWCKFCRPLGTM